jgi:hypothetical protein
VPPDRVHDCGVIETKRWTYRVEKRLDYWPDRVLGDVCRLEPKYFDRWHRKNVLLGSITNNSNFRYIAPLKALIFCLSGEIKPSWSNCDIRPSVKGPHDSLDGPGQTPCAQQGRRRNLEPYRQRQEEHERPITENHPATASAVTAVMPGPIRFEMRVEKGAVCHDSQYEQANEQNHPKPKVFVPKMEEVIIPLRLKLPPSFCQNEMFPNPLAGRVTTKASTSA